MGNDQSTPTGPLLVDADFLYGSGTSRDYSQYITYNEDEHDDNESTSMSYSASENDEDEDVVEDHNYLTSSNHSSSAAIESFYPSRHPADYSAAITSSTIRRPTTNSSSPGRRLASFLSRLDSREFDAAAHSFFMSGLVPYDESSSPPSNRNDYHDASPRQSTNFATYYGEDHYSSNNNNGYGYYREEDDGDSSTDEEDSRSRSGNINTSGSGWMFGRRKRREERRALAAINTTSSANDTAERKTILPKTLSFSACKLGEQSDDDVEAIDMERGGGVCDDSTTGDNIACYVPSFLMRVSQSATDLDQESPSLIQGLLCQRPYGSDPSLLAYADADDLMPDGNEPTVESDLRPPSQGGRRRRYHVVTTAALPWMTGTAVNPLLRAAYLNRAAREEERTEFGRLQNEAADTAAAAAVAATASSDDTDANIIVTSLSSERDHAEFVRNTTSEKDGEAQGPPRPVVFARSPGAATLVVPWLRSVDDRKRLYGDDRYFNSKEEQEAYIRDWLREKAGMPEEAAKQENGGIAIIFYDAAYYPKFGSIFATCDICSLIPDATADVCILEEPEHLNWFTPCAWTEKFTHVVGIIHTNYKAYASAQPHGIISSGFIQMLGNFVVRAHCDKVVNLSGTLPTVAPYKETVCNVHGIRSDFFGPNLSTQDISTPHCQAYYIGKVLWEKGFDKLLDMQSLYRKETGSYFEIDIYGSGPDESEIKRAFYGRDKRRPQAASSVSSADDSADEQSVEETTASAPAPNTTLMSKRAGISSIIEDLPRSRYELRRSPIPARFLGRRDHAQLKGMYKVFVNCSISEVLCTTTAESVAMGNFVIIPDHPSNDFFSRFPNVLMYRSKDEFVSFLQYALKNDPPQSSEALSRELTWEAATERFIEAAAVTKREARRNERMGYDASDERSSKFHATFGSKKEGVAFRSIFLGSEDLDDAKGKLSMWDKVNLKASTSFRSSALGEQKTRNSPFRTGPINAVLS